MKNVSENVRVISVVGRFLEHSRIYYFQNDGKEEIFIGSADLMQRNLNHRVEVVFPLERVEHVRYLRDRVLELYLHDKARAWKMQADGTYKRSPNGAANEMVDIQTWLADHPWKEK
jgi:polyphosphate kinase